MEKLKYLSFALLIALCAGFVSCGDDEPDEPQNSATENTGGATDDSGSGDDGDGSEIVGMWQGVTNSYTAKIDGAVVSEGTADLSDLKIEFKSDGTFVWYDYYDEEWHANSSGSYQYSDGKITLHYTTVEEEGGDSGDVILIVIELTASSLIIESSVTWEGPDGYYEEYDKLTFRRI